MAKVQDNDTYFCGHSKDEDNPDWFVLKSVVLGIFVANIIANTLVLWRIHLSKKFSRANMMFVLLTLSDLLVALISIPLFSLTLFHLSYTPLYIHNCNLNLFVMYFPCYSSWYLTIVIALDRLFIMKYNKKYEEVVSKKVLIRFVISFFAIYVGVMLTCYFLRDSMNAPIAASIFQVAVTIIILFTYTYILRFTRRKFKTMQKFTSSSRLVTSRLTRTIFYIFLCQMIFTLPSPVTNFVYMKHWGKAVVERKIRYWARTLFFANSFMNAVILLQNQHNIKTEENIKPELVGRIRRQPMS